MSLVKEYLLLFSDFLGSCFHRVNYIGKRSYLCVNINFFLLLCSKIVLGDLNLFKLRSDKDEKSRNKNQNHHYNDKDNFISV